jgi:CRISPR-associated endoribonuclease Cas6
MNRFTQYEILLKPNGHLSGWLGHLLHGLLYARMKQVDPVASAKVHEQKNTPFSLCYQQSAGRVCLTLNVWDETLREIIPQAFSVGAMVEISQTSAWIEDVTIVREFDRGTHLENSPLASSPRQRFRLEFLTPTCFKSSGQIMLFPEGRRIIESLYRSMPGSALNNHKEQIRELSAVILPLAYQLQTKSFSGGNYRFNGFTGYCEYSVARSISRGNWQMLQLLLAVAPYSGVGYKTAMGMGAVKVV